MNKNQITCPHCKKHITISLWGFKRVITCPKCNDKIYMDTRLWYYLVVLFVLITPSFFLKETLEQAVSSMPSYVVWGVLLIVLFFITTLIQGVLVQLLGIHRVYRIHDDAYYKKSNSERKDIDRMKNNKKR